MDRWRRCRFSTWSYEASGAGVLPEDVEAEGFVLAVAVGAGGADELIEGLRRGGRGVVGEVSENRVEIVLARPADLWKAWGRGQKLKDIGSLDARRMRYDLLRAESLELPAGPDALQETGLGVAPGAKKPALERVFQPMGYTCRGGSGTFTLRRRTPQNLTAELYLDVGTWSNLVMAIFRVLGVGFKATLLLPVCAKAAPGAQYPIGDAERWQKIVENLGALVAELDRSFVPEIEAAAGPSPEWYQPES